MSKKERTLANLSNGGIIRCISPIRGFKEDLLYRAKDESGWLVTNYDKMQDLTLVTPDGEVGTVGGVLLSKYFEPYEFQADDLVILEKLFKDIKVSSGHLLDQECYKVSCVDTSGVVIIEDTNNNVCGVSKTCLAHYDGTQKALRDPEYYCELARLYNNLAINLKTAHEASLKIEDIRKSIDEHLTK
ncbi:hypothetical protein phi9181_ORF025 [Enterococcus phage 9181]|nr:hypothetical protein phi9181_ORF025 [Enterococcus phage 9181]